MREVPLSRTFNGANLFQFSAWEGFPFQITRLITHGLAPFPSHQYFWFFSSIIHISIYFIPASPAARNRCIENKKSMSFIKKDTFKNKKERFLKLRLRSSYAEQTELGEHCMHTIDKIFKMSNK